MPTPRYAHGGPPEGDLVAGDRGPAGRDHARCHFVRRRLEADQREFAAGDHLTVVLDAGPRDAGDRRQLRLGRGRLVLVGDVAHDRVPSGSVVLGVRQPGRRSWRAATRLRFPSRPRSRDPDHRRPEREIDLARRLLVIAQPAAPAGVCDTGARTGSTDDRPLARLSNHTGSTLTAITNTPTIGSPTASTNGSSRTPGSGSAAAPMPIGPSGDSATEVTAATTTATTAVGIDRSREARVHAAASVMPSALKTSRSAHSRRLCRLNAWPANTAPAPAATSAADRHAERPAGGSRRRPSPGPRRRLGLPSSTSTIRPGHRATAASATSADVVEPSTPNNTPTPYRETSPDSDCHHAGPTAIASVILGDAGGGEPPDQVVGAAGDPDHGDSRRRPGGWAGALAGDVELG